jgi:hypothetical protein
MHSGLSAPCKIFSTLDFQQPKPEKVVTYEVGAKRAA